jgi:hypothetical protein
MRLTHKNRKFNEVQQALKPMTAQGNIVQFLSNAENAQKLNDLVDDIHEAAMDYQVCNPKVLDIILSNVSLRLPCNRTSITTPMI